MTTEKSYNQWSRSGLLHGFSGESRRKLAEFLEEFAVVWLSLAQTETESEFSGSVGRDCLHVIKKLFPQHIENMIQLYYDVKTEALKYPRYLDYHNIDDEVYVQNAIIEKYRKYDKEA